MKENRVLGITLFLALAGMIVSAGPVTNPIAKGKVQGMIFGEDLRTPLGDAVIKLLNIKNGKAFESEPTGTDGRFMIGDIDEGRYVVEISTVEGTFVFGYKVVVKGDEIADVSLSLRKANEPIAGEMIGIGEIAKPATPAAPASILEAPAIGEALLSPDIGDSSLSCFCKPKPPKPPKSRHRHHPW
jgi:hypothetical protein